MKVKFERGKQREFLDLVIKKLDCISLRSLLQFGINTSYSGLKNYYCERRLLLVGLFENLCYLAKLDVNDFKVEYLKDNWGQVKGGRISKRFKNR